MKSIHLQYIFALCMCLPNVSNAQTLPIDLMKAKNAFLARHMMPNRDLVLPVVYETPGIEVKIVFHKEADSYFSHVAQEEKSIAQRAYEWHYGEVPSSVLGHAVLEASEPKAAVYRVKAPEGTIRYDAYINGKLALSGQKECLGSSPSFFSVAFVHMGLTPDYCYLQSWPMLVSEDNARALAGIFFRHKDYESTYKPLLDTAKEVEVVVVPAKVL